MNLRFLLCALLLTSTRAAAHDPQARYLGNEGLLVTNGDTKILFDAFYAESFGGQYTLVPGPTERALMAGAPPFDGVDAVFISHIHPDHFNSRKTIAYLRSNPSVKLYAGLDVIGAIFAADVSVNDRLARQLVIVQATPGQKPRTFAIGGIEIEAFPIPHSGNGPIPHYAYRVTLDKNVTVFHLGDSDDEEAHFSPYRTELDSKRTDVAFVPTWLLASEQGKRVLTQLIRPLQTIAIHADDKYRAAAHQLRKELGADAFVEPGDSRKIGSAPR